MTQDVTKLEPRLYVGGVGNERGEQHPEKPGNCKAAVIETEVVCLALTASIFRPIRAVKK